MDGIDYLIQSRIEGVGLNVAWPYLSASQKQSFKSQTRHIVSALSTLKGPLQYVFPDEDPVKNKGITPAEYQILFRGRAGDDKLGFNHNDLQPSNIIVKDDKIVGIIDWEMSGFFGERAAEVHRTMRCPGQEKFTHLNLPKEKVQDLTFWNDLYNEDRNH